MFTENLGEFFDVNALATSGTFTPTSGSAATVKVIFDEDYSAQFGIAASNPTAVGKASDFGDTVTVGGTLLLNSVTFTIAEREPIDDGALVRLQLRRP